MRIGVVPRLDRAIGGGFQYSVTMLEALASLDTGDEFVVFTYGGESLPEGLVAPGPVVPLRRGASPLEAARARLARTLLHRGQVDPAWKRFFDGHGVELLLFTTESDLALQAGVPYIVAIHDIQHRLNPHFPEVSADGEWERRERLIGPLIGGATAVLVDSEVGREDVIAHFGETGIPAAAVRPLPFLPPRLFDTEPVTQERIAHVLRGYDIAQGYLFCPAQFWPHKNHLRMIEAFAALATEGLDVRLVLAGSHSGPIREACFAEVMRTAEKLKVADRVRYLGYVPDEDMPALYSGAQALLFPTFFGPTNIPVLEAWAFSCSVITSDIRGIREQVGDAGLLVDPASVEAIASAIRRIVSEQGLGARLASLGRERLAAYTPADHGRLLAETLRYAKGRMSGDAAVSTGVSARGRSEVFGDYASYYDALYADKDYEAECNFLEQVFLRQGVKSPASVLDLGCGTGEHAFALARRGHKVLGVDRSPEMIELAQAKVKTADTGGTDARFSVSDLRSIDLGVRFDVVIAMFAVVSYLTTEADLRAMLIACRAHLEHGGCLIFDCWYGPAVLAEGPSATIKRAHIAHGGWIERVASPTIDTKAHTVRVDYELSCQRVEGAPVQTLRESHVVRYWFAEELERMLGASGFELVAIGPFGDLSRPPGEGDWNISVVARAI